MSGISTTATVSKGDARGGVFFAAPAASFVTDGEVASSLITKINTYVSGTGTTDWETLTSGFTFVSDVSDDGIKLSEEVDTEEKKNMSGDTVLVINTSRSEKATLKCIDVTADALKEVYGATNVAEASNVITIHHNGDEQAERIGLMLIRLAYNGAERRMVRLIPRYKVTEKGEETLVSSELFGRDITISTLPAKVGTFAADTVVDFIASVPAATPSQSNSTQSEG